MKKALFFLLSFSALLLVSCQSDADDIVEGFDVDAFFESIEPGVNPGIAYFIAATEPDLWRTHNSLDKKLAALNFPSSLTKKLSTDQLAECCALYPLNINYIAYDEADMGIRFVMEDFNGFESLKERTDYATSLINVYEMVSEAAANGEMDPIQGISSYKFTRHFLENVLLSDYYPEVFIGANGERLRTIIEKYEKTKSDPMLKLGGSEDLLRKIEQVNSAN